MKKLLLSLVVCIAGTALYGVDIQSSINKLGGDDYVARKDGRTELKQAFADVTAPGGQVGYRAAMEQVVIRSLQAGELPLSETLYLFRVLELYGTAASASAVYPFLGHAEKEVRDSARRALVLIPGDQALGYLLAGLKQGPDAERAAYVDALATRGDASVAMDLVAYLESDDTELVKAVTVALGKLGNRGTVPALLKAHQSAPESTKHHFETALLDIGVDVQTAYTLAGSASSATLRATAFRQLIEADPARAKQALTSAIEQADFMGRPLFCAVALGSSSTELQQLVVDYLPNAEEADQAIIVTAIGENHLKQYEAELLALISHQSWLLRMDVIHALGNIGGDASFEPLLKAFLAEPKNKTIANAVARLQAPAADRKALAEVRDGSDLAARVAGMKVLELRNVKGATELLNEIAKEGEDAALREASFKTLESIGNLETIKVCLALILSGDPQKSAIQRSLKRLSLNYGAPDHQWDTAYLPAIESAHDASSREAVVLILDGVASDKTLKYLEQHILNVDSELRGASIRTLQRWSNADSGDLWVKVASHAGSSDADVTAAQRALIKILKVDSWHTSSAQVKLAVKAVQQAPSAEFKAAILSVYENPPQQQKRHIKKEFKSIQDDSDVGATVKQILSGV